MKPEPKFFYWKRCRTQMVWLMPTLFIVCLFSSNPSLGGQIPVPEITKEYTCDDAFRQKLDLHVSALHGKREYVYKWQGPVTYNVRNLAPAVEKTFDLAMSYYSKTYGIDILKAKTESAGIAVESPSIRIFYLRDLLAAMVSEPGKKFFYHNLNFFNAKTEADYLDKVIASIDSGVRGYMLENVDKTRLASTAVFNHQVRTLDRHERADVIADAYAAISAAWDSDVMAYSAIRSYQPWDHVIDFVDIITPVDKAYLHAIYLTKIAHGDLWSDVQPQVVETMFNQICRKPKIKQRKFKNESGQRGFG